MQGELSPEEYRTEENRLRIALENRAQQTLLRYMAGDQVPQVKDDFAVAGELMRAARTLTPESIYLDAREAFFEGRAKLFDKDFTTAANLLERCIRLDWHGAYAYNALGIAYLEQADYARAISAFRDASKRAPHWAYPLHNLALAQVETGEYNAAIKTYTQAIRIRPDVMYLRYNMGLVYQRLNLPRQAEEAYRKAIAMAPQSADPLNALGSLKFSTGQYREAEAFSGNHFKKIPSFWLRVITSHCCSHATRNVPARQSSYGRRIWLSIPGICLLSSVSLTFRNKPVTTMPQLPDTGKQSD